MRITFLILLMSSVLFAACGPKPEEIQAMVQQTVSAIPTQTPYPPNTPYPTYTPYPTLTPLPTITSTPVYAIWTSNQVAEIFKSAGLEVGNYHAMTVEDYGMAPLIAIEGTRFLIPSLGENLGGRILAFDSNTDLEETEEYFVSLGETSAMFFSWTFTKDNILVQINGSLPEEKARQYQQALDSMQK